MSQTNAPQPDTAANAPAEIFDSTIVPAQGQVSQDQLPGPDNREGPMHTGQGNGIDPYFFVQFMALTSFVWDVSASPGQLLFSIPIHPTFTHQFLAHLSKMYNAFVGGIDFALTIAGTGFHAGKLIVVRLPPNVKPESLLTMADITAFPYFIMDPKALETVVKSAMDQRNIMYHYLPYNANDPQTFGGYIAVYVVLPLNTSATGATQISIQVFSRPAQNFAFTQIVPLKRDAVNIWQPDELINALNFKQDRSHPLFLSTIEGLTAFSAKEVRLLDKQTLNAVKLDRTPMNGPLTQRLQARPYFPSEFFKADAYKTYKFQVKSQDNSISWNFGDVGEKVARFTFDGILTDTQPNTIDYIPQFLSKDIRVTWFGALDKVKSGITYTVRGELRPKDSTDVETVVFKYVFRTKTEPVAAIMGEGDTINADYFDVLMGLKQIVGVQFEFIDPPYYDIDYIEYAPPIAESLIVFNTPSGDTAQPWEVREVILASKFDETYRPKDSIVFELIDGQVDLPILPVRLHYDGYFSTVAVDKNLVYKFTDPKRYYFKYVGTIPETTPMVGGRLPTQSLAQYRRNTIMSNLNK